MSDKKSSESRRKLLKSIAAGSGAIVAGKSLPESWINPIVDSVTLPAHAQTSNQIYSVENDLQGLVDQINEDTLFTNLTNQLLPAAFAGSFVGRTMTACATVMGSMLEFEVLFEGKGASRFSGMLPLNKSVMGVSYQECSEPPSGTVDMQIIDIDMNNVVLGIVEGPQFSIPAAPVCVDVPPLVCD